MSVCHPHCGVLVSAISDIGRCQKFVRYIYCTWRTAWENDFELILMVKMETRHSIEGYLGSEFPEICNHCRLMVAWSRKNGIFFSNFLHFLEKRLLTIKFSLFCSESFITTLIDIMFKFRDIWPKKNQNFACRSNCRYCADHAQNLPLPAPTMYSECSRFHPNQFTFSGVIAKCMKTAKVSLKVNPIFGRSLASRRIKIVIIIGSK